MDKTIIPGNLPGGNFCQRQQGAAPQHLNTVKPITTNHKSSWLF